MRMLNRDLILATTMSYDSEEHTEERVLSYTEGFIKKRKIIQTSTNIGNGVTGRSKSFSARTSCSLFN